MREDEDSRARPRIVRQGEKFALEERLSNEAMPIAGKQKLESLTRIGGPEPNGAFGVHCGMTVISVRYPHEFWGGL
jgi:hypothetical protein